AVALTREATAPTRAQILGVGSAREEASATAVGPRYSVGDGLRQALERALADSGRPESAVSFRVADMNGERYRAWESVIGAARFYRTVRERLPAWYPAMSVGDIGAAAGVLAMIVAARGIQRGYAPGPLA